MKSVIEMDMFHEKSTINLPTRKRVQLEDSTIPDINPVIDVIHTVFTEESGETVVCEKKDDYHFGGRNQEVTGVHQSMWKMILL